MRAKAKRLNFMISEDVASELESLIPAGERSRVVNEAVRKEIILLQRRRLTEKLVEMRSRMRPISDEEIVAALRKARAA